MVTNTQFFNGYGSSNSMPQSSVNSELGNSKTQNSLKTTNSCSNNIISDKSKSKSSISTKKDFSEVLNSKKKLNTSNSDVKKNNTKSVTDSDKSSTLDKLKSKVKELKEVVEEENCDENKVNDILTELLNALNNLLEQNQVDDKLNIQQSNDMLDTLVQQVTENDNENSLLQQLLQTISSDETKNSLDVNELKDIKELLQQLSTGLNDDGNEKMNKGIDRIISKLDDMIKGSDDQEKNVIATKTLFKQETYNNEESNNSDMLGQKNGSKEDKFLNLLIEDKKDSVDNKINLFATRTQNVQVQNGEVRGLNINKATFTDDIIKDIKYMSANNVKELTVKVNPGNLGEITIKLIQEDGLMKANLKANSKETTALLSQNLVEIKKELADQNIKISEVNIELYNDDTTFFKNESFGGHLSQEKNNSKSASQNNADTSINASENDELLEDNLAIMNNNFDYLA